MHSPGLRLPPGYALSRPLGVRGQVVDELAADLVGGLEGISLLQHRQRTNGWVAKNEDILLPPP